MSDSTTGVLNTLLHPKSWLAALAGAAGGLAGTIFESRILGNDAGPGGSFIGNVVAMAISFALIGAPLGAALLAYDNMQSLRGRWNRDYWPGLLLFFIAGGLGGAVGQASYSLIQNSLTRGIGWAIVGIGLGAAIGFVRRDMLQAQRGALGGVIGGFIGGFLFNSIAFITNGEAASQQMGMMITGAMIALFMRIVQESLKSAWLLGISTGPYEGKEYPLNTARVTVGRSELNDISLFREESLPPEIGAFVFRNDQWWWRGTPIAINGVMQTQAQLNPDDTIEIGSTRFRYRNRSMKSPALLPQAAPASFEAASPVADFPSVNGHGASSPSNVSYPVSPPMMPAYQPPAATGATLPTPTAVLAPPPAPAPISISANAAWSLRATIPGNAAFLLPQAGQARLGRTDQNQIVVPDSSVSSSHALFEVRADVLTLVDLGSTNGTQVNGRRIDPNTSVSLQPGDRLLFGQTEYTVTR